MLFKKNIIVILKINLQILKYFSDFQKELQCLNSDTDRMGGVNKEGRYERGYLSVYDLMSHIDNIAISDRYMYTMVRTEISRGSFIIQN